MNKTLLKIVINNLFIFKMNYENYFVDISYSKNDINFYKLYNFSQDEIYKIIGLFRILRIKYIQTKYTEQQILYGNFIKSIITKDNTTNELIQSINYINHSLSNNILNITKELKNIEITQFPNLYKYDSIDNNLVSEYELSRYNKKTLKLEKIIMIIKRNNKGFNQLYLSSDNNNFNYLRDNLIMNIKQIIYK